jgi:predicted ATPase
VSAKIRQTIKRRERQLQNRIDKRNMPSTPAIEVPSLKMELAERQQAIGAGGLGVIMRLIGATELRKHINRAIPTLKMHKPYDEADHVFNIALNLLAGGTCLDHLELRRTDEAYLNAVGAQRIPDPTTAGDFCRRFDELKVLNLMQGINRARQTVWKQQPAEFFDRAIIEADGTMVETSGQRKEGIGMNYKKQWGYHPLVVTLANTREVLYIANRSGNRPSHEGAALYFDMAIKQCRDAGFKEVFLRGDTDFALTENFDRWDNDKVKFVFGYDAKPNLVVIAESLEKDAWKPLRRRHPPQPKTEPRQKRPNFKDEIVEKNQYETKHQVGEDIAEFDYRPTCCDRNYRMVVVRKDVEVSEGQQVLFNEPHYFFYITNESRSNCSSRQVVFHANDRCGQETDISQLHACGALAAPLDNLVSNWAYMVIASLAWTLKCWSGLMIRPQGTEQQKANEAEVKHRIVRMEFHTFLQTIIQIPAQIVRTSRRLIYRLLSFRDSVEQLFMIHDHLSQPLRC